MLFDRFGRHLEAKGHIAPAARSSKLATARLLDGETTNRSLGAMLGLGAVDEQSDSRSALANGPLVLYDVTSTYFEGCTCPLATFGYNRDGKSGKRQIVFGLVCTTAGCPVEVFEGNVGDSATLSQYRSFAPECQSR
jgi:hypothetical protein